LTLYQEKEIARLILFLRSDFEYEWDYVDITSPVLRFSFKEILQSILTFGKYYRDQRLTREQEIEDMKKKGDFEYWPFKTKEQFEKQLEHQPFLVGQ
jgi:phenylacetate-coenzyme A ligase PaaK-like adenylate-forming protein